MTISSLVRKAGPFIGNASATVFPFAFKIFLPSELSVISASKGPLILGTDYLVGLNVDFDGNLDQDNNPGGTITLATPLPAGDQLTMTSDVLPLQLIDLTNEGGFYPEVITNALDKLTILIQQLMDALAALGAGGIVGSGSGAGFSGPLIGTVDGVNKVFLLSDHGTPLITAPSQLIVWQNTPLIPGLGYTLGPNPGQVTFANPPQPAAGAIPADALWAQGSY